LAYSPWYPEEANILPLYLKAVTSLQHFTIKIHNTITHSNIFQSREHWRSKNRSQDT